MAAPSRNSPTPFILKTSTMNSATLPTPPSAKPVTRIILNVKSKKPSPNTVGPNTIFEDSSISSSATPPASTSGISPALNKSGHIKTKNPYTDKMHNDKMDRTNRAPIMAPPTETAPTLDAISKMSKEEQLAYLVPRISLSKTLQDYTMSKRSPGTALLQAMTVDEWNQRMRKLPDYQNHPEFAISNIKTLHLPEIRSRLRDVTMKCVSLKPKHTNPVDSQDTIFKFGSSLSATTSNSTNFIPSLTLPPLPNLNTQSNLSSDAAHSKSTTSIPGLDLPQNPVDNGESHGQINLQLQNALREAQDDALKIQKLEGQNQNKAARIQELEGQDQNKTARIQELEGAATAYDRNLENWKKEAVAAFEVKKSEFGNLQSEFDNLKAGKMVSDARVLQLDKMEAAFREAFTIFSEGLPTFKLPIDTPAELYITESAKMIVKNATTLVAAEEENTELIGKVNLLIDSNHKLQGEVENLKRQNSKTEGELATAKACIESLKLTRCTQNELNQANEKVKNARILNHDRVEQLRDRAEMDLEKDRKLFSLKNELSRTKKDLKFKFERSASSIQKLQMSHAQDIRQHETDVTEAKLKDGQMEDLQRELKDMTSERDHHKEKATQRGTQLQEQSSEVEILKLELQQCRTEKTEAAQRLNDAEADVIKSRGEERQKVSNLKATVDSLEAELKTTRKTLADHRMAWKFDKETRLLKAHRSMSQLPVLQPVTYHNAAVRSYSEIDADIASLMDDAIISPSSLAMALQNSLSTRYRESNQRARLADQQQTAVQVAPTNVAVSNSVAVVTGLPVVQNQHHSALQAAVLWSASNPSQPPHTFATAVVALKSIVATIILAIVATAHVSSPISIPTTQTPAPLDLTPGPLMIIYHKIRGYQNRALFYVSNLTIWPYLVSIFYEKAPRQPPAKRPRRGNKFTMTAETFSEARAAYAAFQVKDANRWTFRGNSLTGLPGVFKTRNILGLLFAVFILCTSQFIYNIVTNFYSDLRQLPFRFTFVSEQFKDRISPPPVFEIFNSAEFPTSTQEQIEQCIWTEFLKLRTSSWLAQDYTREHILAHAAKKVVRRCTPSFLARCKNVVRGVLWKLGVWAMEQWEGFGSHS